MRTPIPLAVIGCRFGAHLARELKATPDARFRVQTVCDLNIDLARSLADELGASAITDYREILDDTALPAVALLTRPEGRAALLHELIASGKDVITTKPFEIDAAAARQVLVEARRLGRVVHLNSPAAVVPDDLLTILEWEKRYDLGRPAYFFGSIHASYQEAADGGWYDDPKRCPAAPIFRLGIYLINDVHTLWGATHSVRLLETRIRTGRPTADNAILSLAMENKAVGAIAASLCVQDGDPYRNSLQISYERGTLYRNMGPQRTALSSECELQLVQEVDGSRQIVATALVQSNAHQYNWSAFAEDIVNRQPPSSSYIDRIVNGIETLDQVTVEEQRLLSALLPEIHQANAR